MVSALLGPSPDPFVRPEKTKGWPVSWEHKGSAFGAFGYLPHCDLVPWDQERAKAPERAWPADGAVCRLYDGKRKNKTAWKPTTWQHHGPSFPAVAPLATSLSAPALRNLQKKAKRDKESKPTELDQSLDRTRAHSVACLTAATISSWSRQSLSSPSHASNKAMSNASHGESRMPSKASRRPSKAEKGESVPVRSASKRRQSEPAWKIYGEILLDWWCNNSVTVTTGHNRSFNLSTTLKGLQNWSKHTEGLAAAVSANRCLSRCAARCIFGLRSTTVSICVLCDDFPCSKRWRASNPEICNSWNLKHKNIQQFFGFTMQLTRLMLWPWQSTWAKYAALMLFVRQIGCWTWASSMWWKHWSARCPRPCDMWHGWHSLTLTRQIRVKS